jgi:hypothetical protein
MPATKKKKVVFENPVLSSLGEITVELENTSPLIVHRFGEKIKKQIRDKQEGKVGAKKAPKDAEQEFLDALHVIGKRPTKGKSLKGTRYGAPAVAFKAAAVRAAKMHDVNMTDARVSIFVDPTHDDLVEIFPKEAPVMREDNVRLTGSTSDVRIRPQFNHWTAKLHIRFNARMVTAEQVVSWFSTAGVCNGIGEWRPGGRQSSGVMGCWKVTRAEAHVPEMADVA